MGGFRSFLGKEFLETVRTWRIWVLPGIMLFFALTTPILSKLTPTLLESFAKEQPGAVIRLPDPTYRDAYLEHVSNLSEIVALAVLIAFAGAVNGERRSGTAILVLTKPVSRPAFVAAKAIANAVLLAGTLLAGTLVSWGMTRIVFGEAPPGPVFGATAVWFAFGLLLVGVATLASTLVGSQLGAAGIGLLAFALLGISNLWEPAQRYGPAGVLKASGELALGKSADFAWPLGVSLVLAVVLTAAAALVFRRQEL